MEKRLNRADLGFSLAFLLMLIIAIGAFFYGVKVGTERVRAEYAAAEEKDAPASEAPAFAYQQQDLVSFYHTVFLPYREFQNDWFEAREKWNTDPSADLAASLKELSKTADAKYEKIRVAFVAHTSPLLQDAQGGFLKSLKLFADSFTEQAKTANNGTPEQLTQALAKEALFQEGIKFGLSAQNAYYTSMLKWALTVNPDITPEETLPPDIRLAQWKQLPLVQKNKAAADFLSGRGLYADFLPHDLTARIDQFIKSGQAEKMKQDTIGQIADLLTGTDAVRAGDFLKHKTVLYPSEVLPQLPFFSSDK